MKILIFFGVVIVFSLLLNVIGKVKSYNGNSDNSIWQDGDSVIVKKKDAKNADMGFATRIDQIDHSNK